MVGGLNFEDRLHMLYEGHLVPRAPLEEGLENLLTQLWGRVVLRPQSVHQNGRMHGLRGKRFDLAELSHLLTMGLEPETSERAKRRADERKEKGGREEGGGSCSRGLDPQSGGGSRPRSGKL